MLKKMFRKKFENDSGEIGIGAALGIVAILVVIIVAVAAASWRVVDRGEVGVIDTFGVVDDNSLPSGGYMILPWKHIENINVQQQEQEFKSIDNTLTREGVKVIIDASVITRTKPGSAVNLYKTVRGDPFTTLVTPYFMGILRDEVKKWSAEDIYTGKSTDIQLDVQNRLSAVLEPQGIVVVSVLFRGLVLPPQVTNAIELKLAEQQSVETMNFTVEKQRLEAQRVVIEAQGVANANEIVSKSITPELIQWNFVQAIKGNPNVIYVPIGGGSGTGGSLILPSIGKNP